jgi:methyl-accepting chemotaxis protein
MWTGVLTFVKSRFSLVQWLSLFGVLVVLTTLTFLLSPVIPVLAGFIPVIILIRLNSGRVTAYSLVSVTTALATLKVGSVWLLYAETRLDFKIIGSINLITLMLITWLSLGLVEKAVSKISQAQKWASQHQEQLKLSLLDFEEKQVLGQTAGQDVFVITNQLKKAVARQFKLHQQHLTASQQITSTLPELTHTASNIANSAKNIYQAAEEALTFTRRVQLTTAQVTEGGKRGLATVAQTLESNQQVARLYTQLVEVLNQLHRQSENISQVVALIHSLSSEAQILAFNAALEASGVGTGGERFRVVASEFRTLAMRSVKASQTVDQILSQLEVGIEQAVTVAQSGQRETEIAFTSAQENAKVLGELALNIVHNTAQIQQIEQLVINMTNLTREISQATLQQHSASTQAGQTLEAVNLVVQQNSQESHHLNQTVQHLEKFSKALLDLLTSTGSK